MLFFIQTMGCRINQYESQAIREAWLGRGWTEAAEASDAQIILVHTCAVTAKAVADCRNAVRRAARAAPAARILAAGCAAETEPEGFRQLPGVCAVICQADKAGVCFWPEEPADTDPPTGRGSNSCSAPVSRHEISTGSGPAPCLDTATGNGPWSVPRSGTGAPTCSSAGLTPGRPAWPDFSISTCRRARPILKVQDGCSHGCSYCIVPRARGAARSRPFSDILDEARRLLANGHRELVLSGINLGQFTLASPSGDFWDLLAALERALAPQWSGRARLRLSSLDPGMLTPKALETLGLSSMVCQHLHVSLQSADPGVLNAMGRGHYAPEAVSDFLSQLRTVWPVFALGADLLTGFPGESHAAFATTLDFCAAIPLSYSHVFPFSRRPGTVAARLKGQLPNNVKKERAAQLRQLVAKKEAAFADLLAGFPLLTLAPERRVMKSRTGLAPLTGVCEYYTECTLQGPSPDPGLDLLPVRPLHATGQKLTVEAAPKGAGALPL